MAELKIVEGGVRDLLVMFRVEEGARAESELDSICGSASVLIAWSALDTGPNHTGEARGVFWVGKTDGKQQKVMINTLWGVIRALLWGRYSGTHSGLTVDEDV